MRPGAKGETVTLVVVGGGVIGDGAIVVGGGARVVGVENTRGFHLIVVDVERAERAG